MTARKPPEQHVQGSTTVKSNQSDNQPEMNNDAIDDEKLACKPAEQPPRQDRSQERTLPPELQGVLGRQLRAAYGALVQEPVPDRFMKLLSQLEANEKKEGA